MRYCSKCNTELTPANTIHNKGEGGKVNWCDLCWLAFWDETERMELGELKLRFREVR